MTLFNYGIIYEMYKYIPKLNLKQFKNNYK